MTTTPDLDPQMFELLKTVADRDSLDITDEEIRYGHHRIEGYAWLAEQAFRLGLARERERTEDELAKTRAELDRLRATNGCPSCAAGACDEYIHLSSAHIGDLVNKIGALTIEHNDTRIALAEAKTLLAEYVDGEYPHRRAKQLLAANPATTVEPAAS